MATRHYEGRKFDVSSVRAIDDALTVEEALQINVNDTPFTMTMRTPGNDKELIRGLFHSEGVIEDPGYMPDIGFDPICDAGITTTARLVIPPHQLGRGYSDKRSLLSVSSCGICGKTELGALTLQHGPLQSEDAIEVSMISRLFMKMHEGQDNFQRSGGAHAATAFTIEGEVLATREDIGRHNAVDKVVGALIYMNRLNEAAILTVSGRVSYEIVMKAYKAGIPFLASVSAPSTMAVDFAEKLGITLFAFCRDKRATCYANVHRAKKHMNSEKVG